VIVLDQVTMEPAPEAVNVLCCFNCNLNLTGFRYILRDDKPFCIKCYESLFANRCEECKDAIGTDFKVTGEQKILLWQSRHETIF
jgi:hypothetical protein